MDALKIMSDDSLRKVFVPKVYQPSIYEVDYKKWKEAGIKVISFDIDDTITAWETRDVVEASIILRRQESLVLRDSRQFRITIRLQVARWHM